MRKSYAYKYSIIIPHYNVPELLDRCLASVPIRDDLQILVVDDYSEASSLVKTHLLEKKYPHVQFIFSQKNGGGGHARNIGLKAASGEYVLFADADDTFTQEFTKLLDDYKESNSDIIFFNVCCVDEETRKQVLPNHVLNTYIELWDTNKEKATVMLRYMFGEPWCKIVRKEVVDNNNIVFDEILVHNDTRFSYLVGHYAKSITVDKRVCYSYSVREGSVSKKRGVTRDCAKIRVFGQSYKFFKNNSIPVNEARHWKALYNLIKKATKEEYKMGIDIFLEIGYTKQDIWQGYSYFISRFNKVCTVQSIIKAPDAGMRIACMKELLKYTFHSLFTRNHKHYITVTVLMISFWANLSFMGYCQTMDTLQIINGYRKELGNNSFIYPGVRVNASTGIEDKKENYASTDFVNLGDFNGIIYDLPFSSSAGISFYDKDRRIIPSMARYSIKGGKFYGLIPDEVRYVRFCRRTDSARGENITLYGTTAVKNANCISSFVDGDSRINILKYQIFSNREYKYYKDGKTYYYRVTMPNHQMLNDGTIVAVTELFGDNRYLAIKRSKDGGKSWNNEVYFENERIKDGIIRDNAGGGNPVLLYDRREDVIFLFYQPRSYRVSRDGGLTWGEKKSVAHLLKDTYSKYNFYASPCNGIQLSNGILAIAYRIEKVKDDYDRVCVLFSRDGGNTWDVTPLTPIKDENGNVIYSDETSLVEYKDNCIMLNSRGFSEASFGKVINRRVFVQSNTGSADAIKWKVDGWDLEPESDLKLIDPVCQGSLVKAELFGKKFGVFTNLYTEGPVRENLLVRVAADFKHWSPCLFVTLPGEEVHGYSSMCCINNRFSLVSEDSKGVFYLPFGYDLVDRLMRTFALNVLAYQ